ncbi:MAG: molybdopterin molybdotransferase MoeA, partial [Chloroflexota bacterium]|nr:molybdopterin molybdotransferase MoeA [Chloroflexota bacterium]
GESISRGSLLLKQGTIIRPPEVGVLASVGCAQVKVVRRPTVAILITGEELVDVGQPLTAGKIYDSNTYSVAAQVRYAGGIPKILGVAKDNEGSLVASLRRGLDADMVVTTGGVSMGDYDIVKEVLAREGEMVFWSVRMKPGKPLAVGRIKGAKKDILHIGLPGNPVSVMVTFELFARPALLKMMGKSDLSRPAIEAVLEETVINEGARRFYARAILEKHNGRYFARLTGAQGSGILTSMTAANGLVIVPEDRPRVEKGDVVQVMLLDWSKEC